MHLQCCRAANGPCLKPKSSPWRWLLNECTPLLCNAFTLIENGLLSPQRRDKNVFAPLINRTCASSDLSYAAARASRPLCVQLLCGVDSTNKFPLTNIQAVDLKLRKQKRSLLINQFTLLLLVFWHGSQAHNQSVSRSRCICRLLTKGSRSVTIDR